MDAFFDSKIDLWNIFTSILKNISLYIILAIREFESLNKISTQILPCAFALATQFSILINKIIIIILMLKTLK